MPLRAKDWKQWMYFFLHGRTHVAYGLILAVLCTGYGAVIGDTILIRLLFVGGFGGSLGGLVDTVAHLYYH